MSSAAVAFVMLLMLLTTTAASSAAMAPEADHPASYHGGGGHHRGRGPRRHPHSPATPPPPGPPTPPPPGPLPPCNCACNCSHCRAVPVEGRGSPPTRPALPWPAFGGAGGSTSTPSSPTDCISALAGLMACGSLLTGSDHQTPSPGTDCCAWLATFANISIAAAASAAGNGDERILRCLCPVILGDVNKMLPKPIDPVRMRYLPIACGVVLPPQVLAVCFAGHQTPALVDGRIPDVWEKPSSGALSP